MLWQNDNTTGVGTSRWCTHLGIYIIILKNRTSKCSQYSQLEHEWMWHAKDRNILRVSGAKKWRKKERRKERKKERKKGRKEGRNRPIDPRRKTFYRWPCQFLSWAGNTNFTSLYPSWNWSNFPLKWARTSQPIASSKFEVTFSRLCFTVGIYEVRVCWKAR